MVSHVGRMFSGKLVRFCSTNGFSQLGVDSILIERLSNQLGITTPTEIQSKCLPVALKFQHVVANAETGSGKTLCFLLPILQNLLHVSRSDQTTALSAYSMILVPTPDLAHQANYFFGQLSKGQFNSTIAYSHSRLAVTPTTHLIIATPTTLQQYDIGPLMRKVRILCYDEADVLFVGGQRKPSWEILKTFKKLSRSDEYKRQLILTAATLPTKGPQSIGVLLSKALPNDTVFVSTDCTHSIVPKTEVKFINVPSPTGGDSGETLADSKMENLIKDLGDLTRQGITEIPKVLIFCNSVLNAKKVHERLSNTAGWWSGWIAQLHKEVTPFERTSIIDAYNSGEINVIVCTDVVSRGIDLLDVNVVLMYDFPANVADFLHRSGRTSRAGKSGQVRAYVCPSDKDLAQAIQSSIEGNETPNLSHLFSRNKMLRRKFKRMAAKDSKDHDSFVREETTCT